MTVKKCQVLLVLRNQRIKGAQSNPAIILRNKARNNYVRLRYFHAFSCASASIISSFLATINHLLTNTYKSTSQTVDPEGEKVRFDCRFP